MKKMIALFLSMLVIISIFASYVPTVAAATQNETGPFSQHIHLGECEVECKEDEYGNLTTTYLTICACGYNMGKFMVCEPRCNHNFSATHRGKTFESDICKSCGYLRIHESEVAMLFVTRKTNVESHVKPYEAAETVSEYRKKGERIPVVGRVRNRYNNLWLLLADGSFVWADNLAFDLDRTMNEACLYIASSSHVGENGSALRWAIEMYNNFKPGGFFDFKQGNKLGVDTYLYYVLVGKRIQKERLTGEEIGNINYGYVTAAFGISEAQSIKLVGMGVELPSDLIKTGGAKSALCLLGSLEFCDDANDIQAIKRGWRYRNTGKWK